jgi:hypothetical protein
MWYSLQLNTWKDRNRILLLRVGYTSQDVTVSWLHFSRCYCELDTLLKMLLWVGYTSQDVTLSWVHFSRCYCELGTILKMLLWVGYTSQERGSTSSKFYIRMCIYLCVDSRRFHSTDCTFNTQNIQCLMKTNFFYLIHNISFPIIH